MTNSRILFVDDEQNNEIQNITSENTRLKGEVSILRQNIIHLEKQNFDLRFLQSKNIKEDLQNSSKLKKEVSLLKIQNKIKENQMFAFKKSKIDLSMDIKWALQDSGSYINFKLYPFEYDRLEFYKNYFYNDFCQFDTKAIIFELQKRINKYKEFLEFYILFSCKIDVFKEFFFTLFTNSNFIDKKIDLLTSVPLDWILNFKPKGKNGDVKENDTSISLLKSYIEEYFFKMIPFLYKIVETRPFLLNVLIDKKVFNNIISLNNHNSRMFLEIVCKNGGCSLIDHENISFLTEDNLKALYKDSYIFMQ